MVDGGVGQRLPASAVDSVVPSPKSHVQRAETVVVTGIPTTSSSQVTSPSGWPLWTSTGW
ncbi:MAG: hypothetical protein U0R64_07465 [Candidatus Nanopelagicales bacterium]